MTSLRTEQRERNSEYINLRFYTDIEHKKADHKLNQQVLDKF